MSVLSERLAGPPKPEPAPGPARPSDIWLNWFDELASELLLRRRFRIGDQVHRLCEIEFYLDGPGHEDPFTHGAALQRSSARWYFHRAGESYRGGTYKGLDLSFGPDDAHGGILIRSLCGPDGEVVNGSSLCVEHMLTCTGMPDVASLDAALGSRRVDDNDGLMALEPAPPADLDRAMWQSARVGLTLKRAAQHPSMVDYVLRPYRYLTSPRKLGKGRVNLVMDLHAKGMSATEISAISGSPKHTIDKYLAAYEEGRAMGSSRPLWGKALNNTAICRLHGALATQP